MFPKLKRKGSRLSQMSTEKSVEEPMQIGQAMELDEEATDYVFRIISTFKPENLRKLHILLEKSDYICLCVYIYIYRKLSQISAALGNSATIINLPNNYWGISPTPDSSKDTFHQNSATK